METGCQCSDHIRFCFRAYGPRLGLSGGTVGDSKCPAKFSRCLSSVMTHQIHDQHVRGIQQRVHACLNGGSCLPVECYEHDTAHADDTSVSPPPGAGQSWQNSSEKSPGLVLQMGIPICCEVLRGERHVSCQMDRAQKRACIAGGDQCCCIKGPYRGERCRYTCFVEDRLSQEIPLSCLVQDTDGIPPALSSRFREIIQHC